MVQPRFVLREQFLCSIYPHQPHIAQLNYRQLFTADKRERKAAAFDDVIGFMKRIVGANNKRKNQTQHN